MARTGYYTHPPGDRLPLCQGSEAAKLPPAQIEIVGQFNDYSYENPKLTFEEVATRGASVQSIVPRMISGRT